MSKFKAGDKVKLKSAAKGYSQELYHVVSEYPDGYWNGIITIREASKMFPDDFELAGEPSTEKYHIHHDMIVEWAKDPSRVVEYWSKSNRWIFATTPSWDAHTKYRFKPVEPERIFPKTSLTSEQVTEIYDNTDSDDFVDSLIAVANAAIKQYILDTEKSND